MASFPVIVFLLIIVLATELQHTSSTSCKTKCGSIDIKYPFGSGHGCGSPRFYPYVHCQGNGDGDDHQQLVLTTHTGSYPITSISYNTATLTITPPFMSTCTAMQPAPNFGLDWPGPFQLGSSIFILLSCAAPTSSFTVKGVPICDQSSYAHLCASIHTCPAVTSLGLSLFGPTNTCCVYNPANLNSKGDLDIQSLKCASYASVLSFGDVPTDPNRWVYGIELQYSRDGMDNNIATSSCVGCERSNGVCGYTPPQNNFVCVCGNGVNSSSDCYNQVVSPYPLWSSGSPRVIADSLREEEIAGLREMFKMIDADNSGQITYEELKAGFEKVGANLKDSEVVQLMKAADIDNSGTIDYSEFLAATLHVNKIQREDHLFTAFQYLDKDGSGYLTLDELQQACRDFGLADDHLEEMIKEVDQDSDGRIDYSEFVNMMQDGGFGNIGAQSNINIGFKEALRIG